MRIDDFNYSLPDELIAQFPASERRASRLLELGDSLRDHSFSALPSLLNAGDLLVFNDTRVIPARLAARKETGGRAEILIERIVGPFSALAHVRASKTPRAGSKLLLANDVEAMIESRDGELFALTFSEPVLPFIEAHGEIPLPPYLDRPAEFADIERYQTVYAKDPGAVAAPTAGLHFDAEMLAETQAAGVRHAHVTLHVGAGTFQSLREENVTSNRLHSERVQVDAACCSAVREVRASGGRVIAVGTTSVRALECASASGEIRPFSGETDIFIYPGYEFQSVDAMITNFHLPKSSLLMLVAAFAGTDTILAAYQHAVRERYRFFSYGDAMFLSAKDGA
jgi:S-adenosylmethionine:tRNA ribosyltransferase-isomerase